MDKKSKEYLIASYGTLRTGFSNNGYMRQEGIKSLGLGKTNEEYTMYASGIPFVLKEKGTNITVEVFSVPENVLAPIDRLEGHPGWYKREEIDVNMDDGTKVKAWLYFMEDESVKKLHLVESGNFEDYGRKVSF